MGLPSAAEEHKEEVAGKETAAPTAKAQLPSAPVQEAEAEVRESKEATTQGLSSEVDLSKSSEEVVGVRRRV